MGLRGLKLALPLLWLTIACSAPGDADAPPETDDALSNASVGPSASQATAAAVWSVTNRWTDTNTPAAAEPGIAWDASSGLSWEEKFGRWIASLEKVPTDDGNATTISISTPYGKSIPSPHLDCAEVAITLRALFASWYHLPFFLTGYNDKTKKPLYAGHFGFVDGDGQHVDPFPRFEQYRDDEPSWKEGAPWPKDTSLRALHLDDGSDDGVPFLGHGAGAGAWFDEVVLNKRVGYFLRMLLEYFGSINLADPANMFNITPEATAPGDVLLERWQKSGEGHTLPVFRMDQVKGKAAPSTASGSVPRRQALWDDPLSARHYFTGDTTGGVGKNGSGDLYAKLGGGIHRWRTAVLDGTHWSNVVPAVDAHVYVSDKNVDAISARPKRFDEILAYGAPADRRDAALQMIETGRASLRQHPASCASRTLREDGFATLYAALSDLENKSPDQTDAQYRKLEDYVFAELDYSRSKTCCWDASTAAMAEIILDLADKDLQAAEAKKKCVEPRIFMAEANAGDGYATWKAHAAAMGRAADWKDWSEDEACPQKSSAADNPSYRGGDYCK